MKGNNVSPRSTDLVALAAVGIVIAATLSGCGGGGTEEEPPTTTITETTTSTITTTTTIDCNLVGGHWCLTCNQTLCFSCGQDYSLDPDSITQECVADCVLNSAATGAIPETPTTPTQHNGVSWPDMCITKKQPMYHFYGLGDWGGLASASGNPATAWAKQMPADQQETWNNAGATARRGGLVEPADRSAQVFVARSMNMLAGYSPNHKPDFVLNAGDNFYPGGVSQACQRGSYQLAMDDATNQFKEVFKEMYGETVAGVPWLSVLGNHDFGGMSYTEGWDAQIFRTWKDGGANWRLPAMFWTQRVQYRDFSVLFLMLDSNRLDAGDFAGEHHNICQIGEGRESAAAGCWDMTVANCEELFQGYWRSSLAMAEKRLKENPADWHIINTHFPGPSMAGDPAVQRLNTEYGIDFIFTGHSHQQHMWDPKDGGIPWAISGGGGGVTSDHKPSVNGEDASYGFVDFQLDRKDMTINMYSWGGPDPGQLIIRHTATIQSHTLKAKSAPTVQFKAANFHEHEAILTPKSMAQWYNASLVSALRVAQGYPFPEFLA